MGMAERVRVTIQFHILLILQHPLILGYPWLLHHNPHVEWTTGTTLGWSISFHQTCLKEATTPQSAFSTNPSPDLTGVPVEYHDFKEVFSKAKAASHPTHQPYDCAIDLLLGSLHPEVVCTPCQKKLWRPVLMTLWHLASPSSLPLFFIQK